MGAFSLDPQHAIRLARRRVAQAPMQLADGFAQVVRRSPEARLEQVMSTPARRVILDAIFWQMPQRLNRRQAAGMNATIQWRITGRRDGGDDRYQLTIADGRCRAQRAAPDAEARVTITLPAAEFLRVATGQSDPMQAYFGSKITLAGDVMLAAKLPTLFRIPAAPRTA